MPGSSVIGLDIGSHQIKAVQLERGRGSWSLANAGIVSTPENAVQDGVILDIPRVTEAVRELFRVHRIPALDTVAAVSGTHVTIRQIKVPDIPIQQLRRSIRFEVAKYIDQGAAGSIENSTVEFEVLGKGGEPPQLELLVVVAPNPMVDGRVAVMEGAGLEPVAIDVEAFALLRAMETSKLLPPDGQAVVMINMGATYTDLNIIVGRSLAVPRSIPVGGNTLTTNLASVLNCTPEEAEDKKRLIDISASGSAGMEPGMAPMADPVRQVVMPFVDELIRELRRSVLYFQSQAAEAGMNLNVKRLVLTGGGTQLVGLPEYLRERLEMEVVVLDPLATHNGTAAAAEWKSRSSELAVAVGLALKEYE
jgi:type IV pilus assembly protein PilM